MGHDVMVIVEILNIVLILIKVYNYILNLYRKHQHEHVPSNFQRFAEHCSFKTRHCIFYAHRITKAYPNSHRKAVYYTI